MKPFFVSLMLVFTAACASSDHKAPAAREPLPSPFQLKADAPGDSEGDMSSSELLSKEKRCPKHSKLVNGKCVLNVESDD